MKPLLLRCMSPLLDPKRSWDAFDHLPHPRCDKTNTLPWRTAMDHPCVGIISNEGPGPLFDALRQGLARLGYVEDRNIVIEGRFAHGNLERVPELAAELVGLNVDVIVSLGALGAHAARKVSSNVPIVFVGVIDPIAIGFAATLERPGGNITGITSFDSQQA